MACRGEDEGLVAKLIMLGFVIVATTLEATGDAVVRLGIARDAWRPRLLLFLAGAFLLFFGQPRADRFRQARRSLHRDAVRRLADRQFHRLPALPSPSILVGGALIVIGGGIVAFWER